MPGKNRVGRAVTLRSVRMFGNQLAGFVRLTTSSYSFILSVRLSNARFPFCAERVVAIAPIK